MLLISIKMLSAQEPAIIPQPVSLKIESGVFVLDASTGIRADIKQTGIAPVVVFLRASVKNISGLSLQNKTTVKAIILQLGKFDEIGAEGYLMHVTTNSISVQANTNAGLIYGIQTLLQTIPAIRTNAIMQIPCMKIKDYPRFQYRGMHLDVSRHFLVLILLSNTLIYWHPTK
ncbi:MAG: hypothetical protein RLY89_1409 [Bacteroidota bacterium]